MKSMISSKSSSDEKILSLKFNISHRFKTIKVNTDRDRLRQVVINLVSNAIKFCNSLISIDCFRLSENKEKELYDGIEIDTFDSPNFNSFVAAKILASNKEICTSDNVFLCIKDDGDGIEPGDQEKLFKLFGRISKTNQNK